MKVSERLNVNPGLLKTYANELLRPALPEGYQVGVWRGDPIPIFAIKTYKQGGMPPDNSDPDKVTIIFTRWSAPTPREYHEEDAGRLVALRAADGCMVSGEVADELVGVWAGFLDDVRALVGPPANDGGAVKRRKGTGLGVSGFLPATESKRKIWRTAYNILREFRRTWDDIDNGGPPKPEAYAAHLASQKSYRGPRGEKTVKRILDEGEAGNLVPKR